MTHSTRRLIPKYGVLLTLLLSSLLSSAFAQFDNNSSSPYSLPDSRSATNPGFAPTPTARKGDYVIVSGGPALREWEDLRVSRDQHDKWWGNFIRPARVRIAEIRKQAGPTARITWLVHRPSYAARAKEEGRPLLSFIQSVQQKYGCKLIWFSTGDDFIKYINTGMDRNEWPVVNFEFFGHSNKYCLMFDYSNGASAVSASWFHSSDIRKLNPKAFSRDAFCKSWGCHTGEAMSGTFASHIGVKFIGAIGKTDYRWIGDGKLPDLSAGGRWSN